MAIATFYAWKAKYDGMSVNDAQRLRKMEEQIRQLKPLVADQAVDNQMLRSVIEKKLSPQQRRQEARRLTNDFSVSERSACRVLAHPRRIHRYIRVLLDTGVLRERIRTAAYLKPRDGYRHVWHTLRKGNARTRIAATVPLVSGGRTDHEASAGEGG